MGNGNGKPKDAMYWAKVAGYVVMILGGGGGVGYSVFGQQQVADSSDTNAVRIELLVKDGDRIEGDIDSNEKRINAIESDISSIKTTQDANSKMLEALDDGQRELSTQQTTIQHTLGDIFDMLSDMKDDSMSSRRP